MDKPVPVFNPERFNPEELADLSREVTVTLTKEQWALVAGFVDADGVLFRQEALQGERPNDDYLLGTQASRIANEIDRQIHVSQQFIQIVEGES